MEDLYAFLFTILVLLCVSSYIFSRRQLISCGNKKKLPPSPPKLPIIGNLHQLSHLLHRSLRDLSDKHGPLMLLQLGSKPTLVLSSADAAREILKTNDLSFAGRVAMISVKKILYDMKDLLSSPYGAHWRTLRTIFVHELLSSTRVKSYNSIVEEETSVVLENIKQSCLSSSAVNLTVVFKSLANDLICREAFRKKYCETQSGKRFLEAMERAVGLLFNFTVGEFVPSLGWINWLTGFNSELDKCEKMRDELLEAIIGEHLNKGLDESRDSFVDILLGLYKGNTPGVSIDLITVKAIIMDVFGAGTETSAAALVWAMTELIRHPKVMKKLQDEIRDIMKEKQRITSEDLHKMHYLKAVIKETFRVHPPVALYPRATREYVSVMGYDIEPDTYVLINVGAFCRDPTYWHKPEKYMPDRFLNSSVDFRGFDSQFIPFGAGRRICPGLEFSTNSIGHIIANLVHKFDWALPDGAKGEELDVTEKPGLTVPKKNPFVALPKKSYF